LEINQRFHISNIFTPKNKATYDFKKKLMIREKKREEYL
jgi:hypothetical protein